MNHDDQLGRLVLNSGPPLLFFLVQKYTYLRVDRKSWVPRIWRYNLGNSVFLSFRAYFPYVCHRIFELFFRRSEGWSLP